MAATNKQIYIPSISVNGSFMEEIGGGDDKVVYPGVAFEVELSAEDFENSEDYHATWISITRAVKAKLSKNG